MRTNTVTVTRGRRCFRYTRAASKGQRLREAERAFAVGDACNSPRRSGAARRQP